MNETKNTKRWMIWAIAWIAGLMLTGCTHVQKVQIGTTMLAARSGEQKLPLKAVLQLDGELTGYEFSWSMMGDNWKYPLGGDLGNYARNVARSVFAEVREGGAPPAAGEVILRPRVAKMDHAIEGFAAWSKRNLILKVEWTLSDVGAKDPLWLATVEARASHNAGNVFTMKGAERKLFQELFDNLSTNTVATMRNAPEIRKRAGLGGP